MKENKTQNGFSLLASDTKKTKRRKRREHIFETWTLEVIPSGLNGPVLLYVIFSETGTNVEEIMEQPNIGVQETGPILCPTSYSVLLGGVWGF